MVAIGSNKNLSIKLETKIEQSQFTRLSHKIGQVVGSYPYSTYLPLFFNHPPRGWLGVRHRVRGGVTKKILCMGMTGYGHY